MSPLSAIVLLATTLAAGEAGETAAEKEVKRLAVPAELTPKGKSLLFLLRAEGFQVYRAVKKGDERVWSFVGPDAVLFDYQTGEKVGVHGKGPSWADAAGGKVLGAAPRSAPAPRAGAVPWLLLGAKGKPTGRFAKVTHVQRLDTWGGQAPAASPKKEGETAKSRYHATYAFWGER
jgi:hypothetical protein